MRERRVYAAGVIAAAVATVATCALAQSAGGTTDTSSAAVEWPGWIQALSAIAGVIVAVFIAGVTYVQKNVSIRQVAIAEQQGQIMRAQSELSRQQADDARIFARHQLEETRLARIRANRPRLYIRDIVLAKAPADGEPVSLKVVIANKGSEQGQIIEAQCVFLHYAYCLPLDYIFEESELLEPTENVLPGGTSTIAWLRDDKPFYRGTFQMGDTAAQPAYCIGRIRYLDDAGTLHATGFCRQYQKRDDGQARFYPVDEPSYEYEE